MSHFVFSLKTKFMVYKNLQKNNTLYKISSVGKKIESENSCTNQKKN